MCSIEKLVMRIQNGEDEEAFVLLENKIKPLMHMMYYRHFYYCVELEDFIQEEKYICKYDISNLKHHLSVEEEFLLREEMPRYWDSLSAFEKAVFYFYTSGYSFEEIAEKSNKSVAAIKSAFHRCHKKFKLFYESIHKDKAY